MKLCLLTCLIIIASLVAAVSLRACKPDGSISGIRLRSLLHERTRGDLLEDKDFRRLLAQSIAQGMGRGGGVVSVTVDSGQLAETEIVRVDPKSFRTTGVHCATRGPEKVFYVVGESGEKLQMLDKQGVTTAIFAARTLRWSDGHRFIHSLSLSHSHRLLAFMVSSDNSWRGHTLFVYDLDARKPTTIWKGDIRGPREMFSPYAWVQPLPWSLDDRSILISTPSKGIVSVDIAKRTVEKLCKGYLPIGFIRPEAVLVLERYRGWPWEPPAWIIARHNLKTNETARLVRVHGPSEMRAPVVSPDRAYLSFVALIYPGGKRQYGINHCTFLVSLKDLKYALIDAEVTAWTLRGDQFPSTGSTQPSQVRPK